jgi:outer membrane murein-binding lipoprotein Lpp
MSATITQLVSNPRVGYRLDPGEPGLAPPATATNSAYTVVAQESRNRARLASEAMLEGHDVLLVKTDYQVARVGSFDVVVGGHTTVVSRERPDKINSANAANRQRGQSSTKGAQSQQISDPQKVAQLTAEQQRLERERSDLKASKTSGDSYEASRAKARLVAIDQRLSEIGTKLRKLGVNNTASNLSPAMPFAASGFSAALDATGQLLDLIG